MSTWFECKVRYEKLMQDGKQKKVNEPYLVDAVSFTDAEARINEVLEPYISGDFFVNNMKIANFSDIIPSENGDRWFKCKVSYITIDEEKGVERKSNSYMLIQANNVKEAYDNIDKSMEGMISDYEIPAIQESPIMDVFPYFTREENEEAPEALKNEDVEDEEVVDIEN